MELWDDDGFSVVGSAIGLPLFVEKLIVKQERTQYAQICIKMDIDC